MERVLYKKENIIDVISSLLQYSKESQYKNDNIRAAKLLLSKIEVSKDKIELEPEFIEDILFIHNNDGTKSINKDVFRKLRPIGVDMTGVSFDNVHISNIYFNGLNNVEINIQKIPNYDISCTSLSGVKVTGSLDGAKIERTSFGGYIGNLTLDPQKVQDKSLYMTELKGITVNGSFDDVYIKGMKTLGFKGEIKINPQKVKNKDISGIDFNRIHLVGEYDSQTNSCAEPCFDECIISENNFHGCIGTVVINFDKIKNNIYSCDFTGVTLIGDVEKINTTRTYYLDEYGEKIYLDTTSKIDVSTIQQESPTKKGQSKILTLFQKRKTK